MEEEWQTIEPGVWRAENEGDQITGVLVRKEPKDKTVGYSARYFLKNKEGKFLVWGSAVIDDRMQFVNIGEKIRITFKGKTKNKKNQDVNMYEVSKPKTANENSDENDIQDEITKEDI